MKTIIRRATLLALACAVTTPALAATAPSNGNSIDRYELGTAQGATVGLAIYLDFYAARCEGNQTPKYWNTANYVLRGACRLSAEDVLNNGANVTGSSVDQLKDMKRSELSDTLKQLGGCSTRKMKSHIVNMKVNFADYLHILTRVCP